MRLTALAHALIAPHLRPGEFAADLTAGNGHDTLALANAVGPSGRVWAFDIQDGALRATRERLENRDVAGRVTLVHASNTELTRHLPEEARGRIGAIMANLGHLPGGDPDVITRAADATPMLDSALANLRPGGALSVLAYPGHPGGDDESRAVAAWLDRRAREGFSVEIHGDPADLARKPWLALLIRAR